MLLLPLLFSIVNAWIDLSQFDKTPPFKITSEDLSYGGKWANLRTIHFLNRNNESKIWEILDVAKPDGNVNGLQVIARLHMKGKMYFVFNNQYRIPTKSWSIEFPGGSVDKGESNKQSAFRELEEETGYHATEVLFSTAGKQSSFAPRSNDAIQLVLADIDGDSLENQNVQMTLEPEEASSVLLIESSRLLTELELMQEKVQIASNVYSFAIGYSMAQLGM